VRDLGSFQYSIGYPKPCPLPRRRAWVVCEWGYWKRTGSHYFLRVGLLAARTSPPDACLVKSRKPHPILGFAPLEDPANDNHLSEMRLTGSVREDMIPAAGRCAARRALAAGRHAVPTSQRAVWYSERAEAALEPARADVFREDAAAAVASSRPSQSLAPPRGWSSTSETVMADSSPRFPSTAITAIEGRHRPPNASPQAAARDYFPRGRLQRNRHVYPIWQDVRSRYVLGRACVREDGVPLESARRGTAARASGCACCPRRRSGYRCSSRAPAPPEHLRGERAPAECASPTAPPSVGD